MKFLGSITIAKRHMQTIPSEDNKVLFPSTAMQFTEIPKVDIFTEIPKVDIFTQSPKVDIFTQIPKVDLFSQF